jgi:uncharacterized membrane protein
MTPSGRNLALLAVAGFACSLAVASVPELGAAAVGVALTLFPGLALATAVFPSRIGIPERLALAVALGFAATIFAGLALNWSPVGLERTSWAIVVSVVTAVAGGIAWYRRRLGARERRVAPGPPRQLATRSVILVAVALALIAAAAALARTPLRAPGVTGYTALSLVPVADTKVRVGITSAELRPMAYRVELRAGDKRFWSRRLSLSPGRTWEAVVDVGFLPADQRSVVGLLHRAGADRAQPAYRRTGLVLPGSMAPPTTLLWFFPLNEDELRVGMVNGRQRSAGYRVEVYAGTTLWAVRRLDLDAGEQWDGVLDISRVPTRRRAFEVLVYRQAEYEPRPALRRATVVFPGATAPLVNKPAIGRWGP